MTFLQSKYGKAKALPERGNYLMAQLSSPSSQTEGECEHEQLDTDIDDVSPRSPTSPTHSVQELTVTFGMHNRFLEQLGGNTASHAAGGSRSGATQVGSSGETSKQTTKPEVNITDEAVPSMPMTESRRTKMPVTPVEAVARRGANFWVTLIEPQGRFRAFL